MLRESNTWDIKCPESLINFFKEKKGSYYFKVNKTEAENIVKLLSISYNIKEPKVLVDIKLLKNESCNGMYYPSNETIYMYSMNHAKTIFHEFYHHLDKVTNGKYNGSDRHNYSWIFAEKLWEIIRTKRKIINTSK